MSESLAAFFYLIASILFILALRGLSSPRTARAGNLYGIAGMVVAVATTLASPHVGLNRLTSKLLDTNPSAAVSPAEPTANVETEAAAPAHADA